MSSNKNKSISDSLEAREHLIPYMPYLLQDLWELGCSLEQIVDAVGTLNLSNTSCKILDLGCGKGAVAVNLALNYGPNVVGIDAMPEFLQAAEQKAEEYGVSHLCQFREDDILKFTSIEHNYDLVILASLGGIFGSLEKTIAKLRSQVKQGGYIIIDDGYLKNHTRLNRKLYEHYRDHKATIKELTSFNDTLIDEIRTNEVNKRMNEEYLKVLNKRSNELTLQHPELKADLNEYIQLQREECEVLDRELEGIIWILKKL